MSIIDVVGQISKNPRFTKFLKGPLQPEKKKVNPQKRGAFANPSNRHLLQCRLGRRLRRPTCCSSRYGKQSRDRDRAIEAQDHPPRSPHQRSRRTSSSSRCRKVRTLHQRRRRSCIGRDLVRCPTIFPAQNSVDPSPSTRCSYLSAIPGTSSSTTLGKTAKPSKGGVFHTSHPRRNAQDTYTAIWPRQRLCDC